MAEESEPELESVESVFETSSEHARVPTAGPQPPARVAGGRHREVATRARRPPTCSCARSRSSASRRPSWARSPARASPATSCSSRRERRSRRSRALKDDLSYALATTEIRILAPIPGKQAVGVEVPNLSPKLVTLGDIFGDLPATASPLSVWLGKDISGNADLDRPRAHAAPPHRRHDRARASRAASTRSSPRRSCARRRTRCG